MYHRVTVCCLWLAAIVLAGANHASAQSTFSFRLGVASILSDAARPHLGPNVGLSGKFNIMPLLRVRGQFDVDRVQMDEAVLEGFRGDQTLTFVSIGFGLELGAGTNDVNLLAHIIPHGTIRTTIRNRQDALGRPNVEKITRFSLGFAAGAGVEWYLNDNIGFELLGQFVVYNFDGRPGDPSHQGFRATTGVQFYIGRNFVRP